MTLEETIARKTKLIFELQEAERAGDDARRRRLAAEAAPLEGQIAEQLLAEGRTEDAAVNLVSQASCLLIADRKPEAADVLRRAKGLTAKARLLEWIESTLASLRGDASGPTPAPTSAPAKPFLGDLDLRPLSLESKHGVEPVGLALGPGGLEVAVVRATHRPQQNQFRHAWAARHKGRGVPVLMACLYDGRAALCGPGGEEPPVHLDLDPGQVERICRTALSEPDKHSATRFLNSVLSQIGEWPVPGLRNEGLFATHELTTGVRNMPQWADAQQKAQPLLGQRGRPLLHSLGFQVNDTNQPYSILRAGQSKVAVAVFLDRTEDPDFMSARFNGMSPVQYALAKADEENLDYVIVDHGPVLRVYMAAGNKGVGRRGRSDTFLEAHLDLLPTDAAGYLWLLFAAPALVKGGTFDQILDRSHDYASDLGSRLRERIYNEVVPQLALAIAGARKLKKPTVEDLATTYEMALLVLFRLLFIAYAEDKDLLPYRSNALYRARSLKRKAHELTDLRREHGDRQTFDDSTSLWDEVVKLFGVVDHGKPKEWGVPGYNGGMFSSDPKVSSAGAELARVKLPNDQFGPVLSHLLVDDTPEGFGPVDFRSLGVREFGTVYEGLLESELSVAETDLYLDPKGIYVPGPPKGASVPAVRKGRIYLHNSSGARKSSGSYYTKDFAVNHLLENALEPALAAHLARLDQLNEREASERFFDFRAADIAMGSGHFLVAAVDRIEKALSSYLAKRPLSGVLNELERLREAAERSMRAVAGDDAHVELDYIQLLRRQIARRCVYGVDTNPIAVQLARLSLWIHTFVPGLPLSFLDRNIVAGNSLVGIATIEELNELLGEGENPLFADRLRQLLEPVRAQISELARLSDADAKQIQAARELTVQARLAAAEAEAMLTILTASRHPSMGYAPHFEDFNGRDVKRVRELYRRAKEVLADGPPFHFPIAFPEVFMRSRPGFDVILGNPPWEEVKVEEDEFWCRHQPGFKSLDLRARAKVKKTFASARPDLVDLVRKEAEEAARYRDVLLSGPYPGMGVGDPDLYKAFGWQFWRLTAKDGGRFGVVLPRSALSVRGSAAYRQTILRAARADVTYLANNSQWVFAGVDPRYTIALVCVTKLEGADGEVTLRGPFRNRAAFEVGVRMPPAKFPGADVVQWTDTAALPLLPAEQSVDVFSAIRRSPRLDRNDQETWRARGLSEEIHSKKEQHLMRSGIPRDGDWPVYKGASFDLWTPDTGDYYGWAPPRETMAYLQNKRLNGSRLRNSPFSEFDDRHLRDASTLPCTRPRIAIRRVTNRTNQRTVLAALIPPKVFLADQASCLLWPRGDEADIAFMLAVLSSVPLDWYARRFVETDVRMHVINPLPIPRPARSDPRWSRIVQTAGRLAAVDSRFKDWAKALGVANGPVAPPDRDDMIAELDALVAHLYGLSASHLRHIFESFHEGWDYGPRLDAVLRHYRNWEGKA